MARRTKKPVPRDPYWEVVQSLMQNILTIYAAYREKKPVMLFDVQEQRTHRSLILETCSEISKFSFQRKKDFEV